ncbi:DNA polymerase I [Methylomarinovum caldicuralii]|uniref:DNA polymerase I n=1 Tax=Methylomarinovum caldicuralii TaxID=438856 RepID=A0AAU9BX27_9GAMM|nr:DNA polymerase I [Methylomarinovum caldicuralii]BCX80492.1 DNA polymerase I [Methylomarinovum caldicuralii]
MSQDRKRLVLVDGSSFLYRAFHALPPLSNARGEPTGAIYGVANMLRKLLETYDTPWFAVVFDAPGKTFRNDLFAAYKAHRPPMPDELKVQLGPLKELIRAMGIPVVEIEGVEADDVIATLARRAEREGFDVVVATSDKDLAQLVDDHILLDNTMSETRLDPAGVMAKFGVHPDQIADYLALVGDTSDNVPGVPGIGPKTAAKLLRQYGSLDEIIAHAGEIRGKVGENLRAHLDRLRLSRELVKVHDDLPLDLNPEDLKRRPPDTARLIELLKRFEFTTWLRQLDLPTTQGESAQDGDPADYQAVLAADQLRTWLERLEASPLFAFDTETTDLAYLDARLVGLSFAVEAGEAAYVPVGHDYPAAPAQLDREAVLERLRPLLESEDHPKVGQHLKYDAHVLANHGIELRGIAHDTMLQSYVLNPTATRHDLDSLALTYLGIKTVSYEAVAGKGAKQVSFSRVALDQAAPYAAEDADIALRLHQVLWPKLEAEPKLKRLYQEIEMPLVPVLLRMERCGVLVDRDELARLSAELAERMAKVEEQVHCLAGEAFNLGSPKQIQHILYDKLGLPVLKKTPKGQPSTAEEVLQKLAEDFELPRLILEYRSLSKLKSTYTDKLPQQIHPRTGRVHTSYHQAVTATGRLSSSDPNLQNIPIRTEAGRRIRRAFIAPPGCRLVAADYSQIELRIMAHLSEDANLLAAFAAGADVHRATAAEVFGVAPEAVTDEQRRRAKAINFGLIYGMSAFGLAKQLGIEREEAQSYIDRYFERYPGVREYMERTRRQAYEQGYVETLFGRRLYLPELQSRNPQRRQYAERTAINAPMQGTAADIIKRAMIAVDAWIRGSGAPVKMIMQVHDELVFEVAEDRLEEACRAIRERMASAAELRVPLVVDVGIGVNWDEAH